jgi:hypothetical protein
MRLPHPFAAGSDRPDDVAGVTIDVMTGIVAGVALVLAILILASSLRQVPDATPSAPLSLESTAPRA